MELENSIMNEAIVLYCLLYIIISGCFIFETNDFVSAGITVECLCSKFLGREHDGFIQYHLKRICLTIAIHLALPYGFFFGFWFLKNQHDIEIPFNDEPLNMIMLLTFIPVVMYAVVCALLFFTFGWNSHPLIKRRFTSIKKSWEDTASEINDEYRRIDTVVLHQNNSLKLIITRSWIISVSTYNINFAKQCRTHVVVKGADTHDTASGGISDTVQYLTLQISSTRAKPFIVRLKALDFKDFKDAATCPVIVLNNIVFHQTKIDKFLEVFRCIVKENPTFSAQERDTCIGCMVEESNVKLVKCCTDSNEELLSPNVKCAMCNCRPMWCVDCMGRWFASRQNQQRTDTWLSSKCTCPVCRNVFCVLDVCPLENV